MLWTHARRLTAIVAAALLAVFSIVSTYSMVPDQDARAWQAAAQYMGATVDDFCSTTDGEHDHRCPFCHKLPEPPTFAAGGAVLRIVHVIGAVNGRDLVRGPQHIRPDVASRAPPFSV